MDKVFIINGYPGAGKDKFIEFCARFVKVQNISSVDPAKQALMILGWDGKEKTQEVRDALSNMKDMSTDLFDGPVTYVKKTVHKLRSADRNCFIFAHARESAELTRYRNELGATIIFIDRESEVPRTNHADQLVKHFDYDVIVDNNGTLEDLEIKAYNFINEYN